MPLLDDKGAPVLGPITLVARATDLLDSTRKAAPRTHHASSFIVNALMCVWQVVDVVTGIAMGSGLWDGCVFLVAVLHDCRRLDMLPWSAGLTTSAGLATSVGLVSSAGCWF